MVRSYSFLFILQLSLLLFVIVVYLSCLEDKKKQKRAKTQAVVAVMHYYFFFVHVCLIFLKVMVIHRCRDEGHVVWLIILYIYIHFDIINYCEGYIFNLLCVQVQLSVSLHCFHMFLHALTLTVWFLCEFIQKGLHKKMSTPFYVLCHYSATNVIFVRYGRLKNDIYFILCGCTTWLRISCDCVENR